MPNPLILCQSIHSILCLQFIIEYIQTYITNIVSENRNNHEKFVWNTIHIIEMNDVRKCHLLLSVIFSLLLWDKPIPCGRNQFQWIAEIIFRSDISFTYRPHIFLWDLGTWWALYYLFAKEQHSSANTGTWYKFHSKHGLFAESIFHH